MEDVTLAHAKEHLEDLIARARQGEVVTINDERLGVVRIIPEPFTYDLSAPRLVDTMPPFVPLAPDRILGRLEGIWPKLPDEFFDPMSDEELKDWYGDDE